MPATIHVFGPRDKQRPKDYVNTTSHGNGWESGLSPFKLGPIRLYDGMKSLNFENAWQYSKVYARHDHEDDIEPTSEWWVWAKAGWANPRAVRYPMGKGAVPVYSWWNGQQLGYVAARKKIYCPLYAKAVEKTSAWKKLKQLYRAKKDLWLWDFDGYDHRALKMSYRDVLECPTRKMGHAFVLAMMLEDQREWENR